MVRAGSSRYAAYLTIAPALLKNHSFQSSFSCPEPPFLLVTWSEKRRALVAAITDVRKSRTSGSACLIFAKESAHAQKLIFREGGDGKLHNEVNMACLVSDGFQEALGESMTAFSLGGLVLKEEQKADLYAVTLKKQDCLCILPTGFGKSLNFFYYYILLILFYLLSLSLYFLILFYFILFTHEVARPRNAGRE